ncbi:MAG: phosphomannomutase/phosphoglucomutase, partial [Actinomycetota bacterium]|nr:phosphomannomutase/phosphoglucomutase [Actinomycetota bacterium]
MTISADIFKAYDIRGIHGRDLDAAGAHQIGRAFARVVAAMEGRPASSLRLALGRDMRLTAPEMAAAYARGMAAEGAQVIDAGQVGTEMLYFLVGWRDLDGGLMCTASHNPKAYTGAKLVRRGAVALSGEQGIGEIKAMLAGDMGAEPGGGRIEQLDIYPDFHRRALTFVDAESIRPLRVVVDGGNGMAGPMVGPLLELLGLDLATAYWTPDGEFPDHEPNPLLPENRAFIIGEVRRQGADLGIAWDGDADRCFFIDDTGQFVDGDFLTAVLAGSMLRKHPGETILYDVRASRAVPDTVGALGGTALINRVGHAFFKARMRTEGGIFGGEVSGHYYFRDFYCADSGTIPALLMLEELSRSGVKLSDLLAPLRARYFISGEINSEVADPQAKLEEISQRFPDARQERLDGISIDYPDWHFNVRASNTEPLLRLCLESLVSQADMAQKRDAVL